MTLASCPNREQLAGFSLGTLPELAIERLSEHFEACTRCQLSLETLDRLHDPLLHWLQSQPGNSSVPPVGLEHLVDRAASVLLDAWQEPAPDAPIGATTSFELPTQLGQYRLLERLGQGGMGAVYKALHLRLEKLVALKLLPADLLDPAALARFDREMKAVGQLQHANIVAAHDAGEAGGQHFLVMELIDGLDLSTIVRRLGPLPVADACELARQTATGLAAIHRRGLVHRDIKPSNLMLDSSGRLKILDLGLALLCESAGQPDAVQSNLDSLGAPVRLTSARHIMGTADYMAPEQIACSHAVDIRADLYSLGCTLYKLLTGRAPFAAYATGPEKIWAHANAPIPPLGDFREAVPAELATVLERLLARRPEDRYPAPDAAAAALAPFAAGAHLRTLIAKATGVPGGLSDEPESTSRVDESADDANASSAASQNGPRSAGSSLLEPAAVPRWNRLYSGRRLLVAIVSSCIVAAAGWLAYRALPPDAVLNMTFDQETLYERDGQTYVKDLGSSHNDGLIRGATWTADGKVGGAMYFDGVDDYIELSDRGFPEGDQPRSITLWFKTAGISPPDERHAMTPFRYGDNAPGYACYLAMVFPTYDRLAVGDSGGGPWEQSGATVVTDDKWHHAALVYDGNGRVALYLDGKLELDYARHFVTMLTGKARIGHGFEGERTHFKGVIDDVRVFDTPLYENDVKRMVEMPRQERH